MKNERPRQIPLTRHTFPKKHEPRVFPFTITQTSIFPVSLPQHLYLTLMALVLIIFAIGNSNSKDASRVLRVFPELSFKAECILPLPDLPDCFICCMIHFQFDDDTIVVFHKRIENQIHISNTSLVFVRCKVLMMIYSPIRPAQNKFQNCTCAINAYGFSLYIFILHFNSWLQ